MSYDAKRDQCERAWENEVCNYPYTVMSEEMNIFNVFVTEVDQEHTQKI